MTRRTLAPFSCGCGLSVAIDPLNTVARASTLRNDGKASGNGRERINRNGMATENCQTIDY
jgi:hypothetical protein